MSTSTRRARGTRLLAAGITAAMVAAGVLIAVPPAGAADAGAPVVLILDASGSMVRDAAPGRSRMQVAQKAAHETLGALPAEARVGVLAFGTGTGNTEAERAAGCTDVTTVAPLATVDAAALHDRIEAIVPSGFTPIGPALRAAAAMLPPGQEGDVVLVSDGVDTCGPPSSCEVASELHRDNPQLSIHVVAFGVDDDEAAQQQLACIGSVGGGTSVQASDPTQLASALRAAADTTIAARTLGSSGMRGVTLGMTLDEVRHAVDGATVSEPQTVDGVEVVYVDCDWGRIELRDGRVTAITPDDASTPTAEGLAPGDTTADADALYGASVDVGTTADGSSRVYQTRPGSRSGYRVFVDGDRILRILVCRCVPVEVIASDIAAWEVTFEGVGPLDLGMTEDAAKAAVPALASSREPNGAFGPNGAVVPTFADGRLVGVTVSQESQLVPTPGSALPHARGIRLGDSGATAANAFPGGSFARVLAAGQQSYFLADRAGRIITFGTTSGPSPSSDVRANIRTGEIVSLTIEDGAATRAWAMFPSDPGTAAPASADPVEAATAVLADASRCDGCSVSGSVPFTSSGGDGTLVTFMDPGDPMEDVAAVAVRDDGAVLWQHIAGTEGQVGYYAFEAIGQDRTGNILIRYNPGRYDGVYVLRPDHGWDAGEDVAGFGQDYYYAEATQIDGEYVLTQYANDCDPDCAGGRVTSEQLSWNGSDYAARP